MERCERLLARHDNLIYYFARNRFKNPEDVEDLVQETRVHACINFHKWDICRCSFGSWLKYIVLSRWGRMLSKMRHDDKRARVEDEDGNDRSLELIEDPDAHNFDEEDLIDFRGLDPTYCLAFRLRYVQGMTNQEVSGTMGKDEKLVKAYLEKAVSSAKRQIEMRSADVDARLMQRVKRRA